MSDLPLINLVTLAHLVCLGLWGGVVAAESVLELHPFRRRELHAHSIECHYWIDLLVELPLIIMVLGAGIFAAILAGPMSGLHFLKIGCALTAVSANLVCVILVFRRRRLLKAGTDEDGLWRLSRRIVLCAVIGLPFAAIAAATGFWLAGHRILELIAK